MVRAYIDDVRSNMRCAWIDDMLPAYHNFGHAVDTLLTVSHFVFIAGADTYITPLDGFALCLAALGHDVCHPGVNNMFHISTQSSLAIRYSDIAVLENHSAAVSSMLLRDRKVLAGFSTKDWKRIRAVLVASILATDMSSHVSTMARLNEFVETAPWEAAGIDLTGPEVGILSKDGSLQMGQAAAAADGVGAGVLDPEDRKFVCDVLLHCADVGNPCKPWRVSKIWSDRVIEEFFLQGDREAALGMPISPNMDRSATSQCTISVGFVDYIVRPIYMLMNEFLPRFVVFLDELDANRSTWESLKPIEASGKSIKGPDAGGVLPLTPSGRPISNSVPRALGGSGVGSESLGGLTPGTVVAVPGRRPSAVDPNGSLVPLGDLNGGESEESDEDDEGLDEETGKSPSAVTKPERKNSKSRGLMDSLGGSSAVAATDEPPEKRRTSISTAAGVIEVDELKPLDTFPSAHTDDSAPKLRFSQRVSMFATGRAPGGPGGRGRGRAPANGRKTKNGSGDPKIAGRFGRFSMAPKMKEMHQLEQQAEMERLRNHHTGVTTIDAGGGDPLAEVKKSVLEVYNSKTVQFLVFWATIIALVGDSFRSCCLEKGSDFGVNVTLIVIFGLFVLELIILSLCQEGYFLSFFFYVDLLGTASLVLDVPWLMGEQNASADATASLQFAKAGRAARTGARATKLVRLIRFVRLVRMVRAIKFFSGFGKKGSKRHDRAMSAAHPSSIGFRLAEGISRRMLVLVLTVLLVTPLLVAEDTSNEDVQHQLLRSMEVMTHTERLEYIARGYTRKFIVTQLYVHGVDYYGSGGVVDAVSTGVKGRAHESELRADEKETYIGMNTTTFAVHDRTAYTKETAVYDICLVSFMLVLLSFSSFSFTQLANDMVVKPVERMLKIISKVSSTLTQLKKDAEAADFETDFLENSVAKISELLRIGFGTVSDVLAIELPKDGQTDVKAGRRVRAVFCFCDIQQIFLQPNGGFGWSGASAASSTLVPAPANGASGVDDAASAQAAAAAAAAARAAESEHGGEVDTLPFVLLVAYLVHGNAEHFHGDMNQSVGNAFLLVWNLGEESGEGEHGGSDVVAPLPAKPAAAAQGSAASVSANRGKRRGSTMAGLAPAQLAQLNTNSTKTVSGDDGKGVGKKLNQSTHERHRGDFSALRVDFRSRNYADSALKVHACARVLRFTDLAAEQAATLPV